MRRVLCGTLFVLFINGNALASEGDPVAVLKTYLGEIREVFSQSLSKRAKKEKIAALLDNFFDFEEITRLSVGKHLDIYSANDESWRKAYEYVRRICVARVLKIPWAEISFVGAKRNGEIAVVSATARYYFVEIPLKFKLRLEGRWKVFEIEANGRSLILDFRNKFNAAMRKLSEKGGAL